MSRLSLTLFFLTTSLAGSLPLAADEAYEVRGLEQPAEILVDRWGVPHIYARTHYDAFFVQGFNAARDRLWQIDLWRRRGLGELSEILGPAYVEQDVASRMFLYRGHMFTEWLAYGSDAKRIAQAFTAGINAYVELTERRSELLPPEFDWLGYRPARWAPEDVVRIRSNGLWRNLTSEVMRARTVCRFGLEVDAVRRKLQPPWKTTIPDGLDPCVVPADVDRLYRLARAPVDFSRAVQFAGATAPDQDAWLASIEGLRRDAGSNNWAVAPSRTTTGRPVLANDPHRAHAVPSLRYIAHLVAPGLNVIGAGEPALPGISIGHNTRIAFGLTIFSIDQEDLMVYDLRRGRYRYQDAWREFDLVEEKVNVRGGEPRAETIEFTVHGPVIHKTAKHAFAVQAAWLEPGMAPYFGSVEYMRAQNWREFLGALNRWGAPAENQVYADIEGNIGYKPAGLTPIRPRHDGLLPVPGDGRYDWTGFYDMDQLPVEFNPERGWVGTANAMSLPDGFPYRDIKTGFEWSSPWRISRIAEVLDADDPHSMSDSLALQRDYLSLPARRVLSALTPAELPGPAASLFEGWDFRLERESAAAALFQVWYTNHLKAAVIGAVVDAPVSELGTLDPLVVIEAFEAMDPAQRRRIASSTLEAALTETARLLGDEPRQWRWGDLHLMKFEHPLFPWLGPEQQELVRIPVVSRGGSGDTPNATSFGADFSVRSGGSWRMVIDVGNWDNAFMTSAPGQSGDPRSPHYDDMLESWAEEGQLPLLYSRDSVERHVRNTIKLEPAD